MALFSHRSLTLPSVLMPMLLAACSKPVPAPEPPRPVQAAKVTDQQQTALASYSGEVRARYETKLAFRVNGKITRRWVENGAHVKAGQVLAEIDPSDYQLSTQAKQAQLASARAELGTTQADWQRYQTLHAQNFISAAELQRRETAYIAAQAKFDQARAELSNSGNQVAYTRLLAPHAGVVTGLEAEAGQVVNAGQTILRLANPQELEVVISVAENQINALKQADGINVRLWADPDHPLEGRLRELAADSDSVTRTYSARIQLLKPSSEVRLGMTANVWLSRANAQHGFPLPPAAILEHQGKPHVWLVNAQRQVQLAPINVVGIVENQAIVQGLPNGATVVTAGAHLLHKGQVVRLLGESK